MRNALDALSKVGSHAKVVQTATGARRVKSNAELLEQEALIQWADLTVINGRRVGDYLVHVPNEGKRGPKAASEFKRAGGRAGYPDLILELPAGEWHGLRIEMKAKGGKPTAAQLEWIERLRGVGYRAEVCYGFDEARIVVMDYLRL
ncbi:VRR-NUC domain-containing protein [Salmonella enterica]|nr:VRR-NUC domain-containing protein [Salmonella enterica]EDI9917958.1 VRR-NUC domain-containing protein [Salmonella enterica]EGA9875430.1 VRR-NUC domain-containing protein [Salmonella enterica]EGL5540503.1 VRR-NUC domain-containing protein [Salmonella enterica]EGM0291352.1 VRR-NUC domain-containing protein [Salmonella enterica]